MRASEFVLIGCWAGLAILFVVVPLAYGVRFLILRRRCQRRVPRAVLRSESDSFRRRVIYGLNDNVVTFTPVAHLCTCPGCRSGWRGAIASEYIRPAPTTVPGPGERVSK